MPLNKLDNFLKNVEGRILYVSPSDLDASDAMSNQGNSQTTPFKTVQRALIEAARFSYVPGNNNDITEKTTILLMPGDHIIDNRPGYKVEDNGGAVRVLDSISNVRSNGVNELTLNLDSNFDLTQEDNILRKFNSIHGGVIVPRGTSIVGLDLRKTKIRPKYVPNPTDDNVPDSAIFRITGACYFWQFSIFDGKLSEKVYVNNSNFDTQNLVKPSFSHHKLTCFEYADGVNRDETTNLTDLNMYYYKLSIAYGTATEDRDISEKFPTSKEGFVSKRPEFEIVGAFASDPIRLSNIQAGDGVSATALVTVTTLTDHGLDVGTPIRIKGVDESDYNVSTTVTSIDSSNPKVFTYVIDDFKSDIVASPAVTEAEIIVETDTVNGASPYIFNISLRSVFGMNGMHADGNKATGFRSMVVAQFTGVSLQKDDRAFVEYNKTTGIYEGLSITTVSGEALANESSATTSSQIYHLSSNVIYRSGWETRHVKISNNSILQIVSVFAIGYAVHFESRSGGDASITNSNSNFGQLALVSDGFRKDAFEKDDRAFITHILPPRAITSEEEDIDWVSIDQSKGSSTKLYLFGFDSEDIKPPFLTQGFRIGAKKDDKLFVDISGEKEASIRMDDGTATPSVSSVKQITINTQENGLFTSPSNHLLLTGEKVIVISDDGDLPENIEEKIVYFAIKVDNTRFRLASSKTNADNGEFIKAYRGTNLTVLSRVTDKESGDVGHPVQWDGSQWYINVSSTGNTITGALSGTTGERTEPSFVKRISDTRSLDEKIYRVRLAIPKEIDNSKNPENGFILQESANTGVNDVNDFTRSTDLTNNDFLFNRNPRFISSCTFNDAQKIVTIQTEKPHNLSVGDAVTVKNIKDSIKNTTGVGNSGYNGEFTVTDIPNSLTFKYSTDNVTIGNFGLNDFQTRTLTYPRFERTDLKSNIYVFRNNIISEYINDIQDGVYQIFPLNSSNNIPTEYEELNYSQNVVDLYPQLDRDNINENPQAAKSFAVRSPLGQVVTNDPLKSITRETNDKLMKKIGIGLSIFSFTDNTNTGVVSFTREHNFGGIMTASLNNGSGSGFTNGTYLNVKVFNSQTQNDDSWNGTLANVIVGGGNVTSFEITNAGSGWQVGEKGYFDTTVISGSSSAFLDGNNAGAGLTVGNIGVTQDLVLQTTGVGNTSDGYFRITSVPNKKEVVVAKRNSDVNPIAGQYGFTVSSSSKIASEVYDASVGIQTVTTVEPHGLVAGNRFQLNNASNLNQGSFIVKAKVGVTTFTFETASDVAVQNGYILKHGLSANDGASVKGNENLSIRGVDLFDNETSKLNTAMDNVGTAVTFSTFTHNIQDRFPYSSYILIDEEIMRVSSKTVGGGSNNNVLTVLRGVFGTVISSHVEGSLIKKIKPFPIQFNRPSILRASGHTFEYLGYGPGNYSTALPQVQVKTISEKEEFLSQSQERSSGAVVYTGMNNKGDFYIGNQKKSALTGEEISFDTPIPTVSGEDPGRLSVVFDEVTVKERLVVEGGKSKTALSEFDGPVTFNNEVQLKDALKIKSTLDSTSSSTGSLVISGGVGIAKTVHLPDNSKMIFGNGLDLEIFHQSSSGDSFVRQTDTAAGDLRLVSQGTHNVRIQSGNGATGQHDAIICNADAGVDIKFNNATKFVTTNTGVVITGICTADSFEGNGSQLTGIDKTKIIDVNGSTRAQATVSGVTISGDIVGAGATFGNVEVGFANDQTVTTSSGKLILDAFTNEVEINSDIDHNGTLNTSGNLVCNGSGTFAGDVIAFSSSDLNLKENVSQIDNALEMINSLSGNTFAWKPEAGILGNQGLDTGIIAQEVEALGLPGVAKKRGDGTIGVRYDRLIPVLIEAVKELTSKVNSLENK